MAGVLAKPSGAEDRREPLKSKNREPGGARKGAMPARPVLRDALPQFSVLLPWKSFFLKKVQASWERDGALEKPGSAACPRSAVEAPLHKAPLPAVLFSATLSQELSLAMQRMHMVGEQEYAYDIFRSLMQEQPRYTFRASDMPRAMTGERRALIVNWLVQVHEYLKLADDTLYLAVYLMNAYLVASKVRVATLQLLSVTCLFLACKVEESTCPQPSQLCFMTEGSSNPKELLRMERKVLSCLKFELHYANPVPLLRLLAEAAHASPEVQSLAMYFMELSLREPDSVGFEPAQLSVAALRLAQQVLGGVGPAASQPPKEDSPQFHMYSESELSAVYPSMAQAAVQGASSILQATFWKYSRPQRLCISTHAALASSAYLRGFLGNPTL